VHYARKFVRAVTESVEGKLKEELGKRTSDGIRRASRNGAKQSSEQRPHVSWNAREPRRK
jgi:hypothetical protein